MNILRLSILGVIAVCTPLFVLAAQWQSGTTYSAGDTVDYNGSVYACKPWPYDGWCSQREPGTNGWEDAWEATGASSSSSTGDTSSSSTTDTSTTSSDDTSSTTTEEKEEEQEEETLTTDKWGEGNNYEAGDLIYYNGDTYACRPFPYSPWCDQRAPGDNGWEAAWVLYDGEVSSQEEVKEDIQADAIPEDVEEDLEGLTDDYGEPVVSPVGTPGKPQISWMSPSVESNFSIPWAMYWGENGSLVHLYFNGKKYATEELTRNSPLAQSGSFDMKNIDKGEYTFRVELCHENECAKSNESTVTVIDAEDPSETGVVVSSEPVVQVNPETPGDTDIGGVTEEELLRIVASSLPTPGIPDIDINDPSSLPENAARAVRIFPEELFELFFPVAADAYTYEELIKAIAKFPSFCGEAGPYTTESLDEVCARELATVFAHGTQETGGHSPADALPDSNGNPVEEWRQGFYHIREMGCSEDGSGCEYRGGTCNADTWQGETWPCPEGKKYYGRGAKQLSYNFNYGPFSDVMFEDVNVLLEDPDRVGREGWLAMSSALWFFMTPQSPKPSMHDVVAGFWQPNEYDKAAGIEAGFGATINIINGGIECGGRNEDIRAQNRIDYYHAFTKEMGIEPGEHLGCAGQARFPGNGAGAIDAYWERSWAKENACQRVSYQTPFSIFKQGDEARCIAHHFGKKEEAETQTEEVPAEEEVVEETEEVVEEPQEQTPVEETEEISWPVYKGEGKIIGYFPEWGVYSRGYHIADIPADSLTHVNYGFARIVDGKIAVWDDYAALQKHYEATDTWDGSQGPLEKGSFNQIKVLREKYPHLKFLISVGGWTGSKDFYTIAGSDSARKVLAQSARDFVEAYGFDGVDIDWEFPGIGGAEALGSPADKDNFTALMRELRLALGDDYLLTAAMSANPEGIKSIDYPAIEPYMDWITIMSYDFHGSWQDMTGHNAPLYNGDDPVSSAFNLASAAEAIADGGMPREKIIPGLAFYGRSWSSAANAAPFQYAKGPGPGSFEQGVLDTKDIYKRFIGKDGWQYYFDEKARVPYLHNAAKKEWISFDDEQAIQEKVNFIIENSFGGAMFWELSGDDGRLLDVIAGSLAMSDFSDISEDDPFYDSVKRLVTDNIISGNPDGTLDLDAPINRAEFSAVLVAAMRASEFIEEDDIDTTGQFPDVTADDWFAPYVDTLAKEGIVSGFDDGNFYPNNNVTFAEGAKMITNGMQIPLGAEGQNWWDPFINGLKDAGLLSDELTSKAPDELFSRGEIFNLLEQSLPEY